MDDIIVSELLYYDRNT